MASTLLIKSIIALLGIGTITFAFFFFKKKRKEIILLAVSIGIAITIGEFLLRIFLPQINNHNKMFEYDPTLGWKFVSNGKGQIIYPGGIRSFIETNSLGFRDHAPSDKKKNRLMVLGDSFVSNISVRDREVFTEIMEDQLNEYDVLNFGVNGYGQVQEYLLLKKWVDAINPDVIILIIYLQNDFIDNMGPHWLYARPSASLEGSDSVLTIHKHPTEQRHKIEQRTGNLFSKSHINGLITRAFYNLFSKPDSLFIVPEYYTCQSPIPDDYRMTFKLMQKLLIKIEAVGKEKNVPVVFALAPSNLQVDDELWKLFLEKNADPKKNYIRSAPNDRLMQFAKNNNLLMFDLLPIFLEEQKKAGMFYHPVEQHWTIEGNRVVANALINFLESHSLIE